MYRKVQIKLLQLLKMREFLENMMVRQWSSFVGIWNIFSTIVGIMEQQNMFRTILNIMQFLLRVCF